ncbi:MAG TPA: hypothetical protein VL490_10510 [Mucilaginibacter sp.]|jgi:hypothetical protein|nr:hypothetical protein [Mucilaginibacter sp.]
MTKKYILKPGKHQFAPGSPATHDNDNLSDEEAAWYMEKYPHIKTLFIAPDEQTEKIKPKTVKQNSAIASDEFITPSLEDKGGK